MKMRHVTIQTGKMEESVAFYEAIAGLTVQKDLRGKGPLEIVFLSNAEGETCVELISAAGDAYEGSGISIGFEVEDVEAYREELKERRLNPTPVMCPAPGAEFFFVQDPNGVQVQFIGRGRA